VYIVFGTLIVRRHGAVDLTRNVEVVGSSPIKAPPLLLLSTGWF